MLVEGQGDVGAQGYKNGDGNSLPARFGATGEFVANYCNPRYTEGGLRGNTFTVCNTGSMYLSINSTSPIGLMLCNPAGSLVNISILEVNVDLADTSFAASAFVLSGNADNTQAQATITTSLPVVSTLIGSAAASVALVGSAGSMPNNTIFRVISGCPVTGGGLATDFLQDKVDGALVLGPNTCVAFQASGTNVGALASFTWAEIPI